MWAPGSRRRSDDDSACVTRQPVTTMSFSGSPGRNSWRRGSSAAWRSRPVGGAQRPHRRRALGRHREGGHQHAARGRPGRAGWHRAPPSPPASGSRTGPRRRTATGRPRRGRPPRARRPDRRPAGRPRARSPPSRPPRGQRDEPAALVRQRGRAVHLEPARRTAPEAQRPAVVAGTEQDDLGRAAAEGAGHLGVDHLRPSRQHRRPADRDGHRRRRRRGRGARSACTSPAGRGRARVLQAQPLRRDPAAPSPRDDRRASAGAGSGRDRLGRRRSRVPEAQRQVGRRRRRGWAARSSPGASSGRRRRRRRRGPRSPSARR